MGIDAPHLHFVFSLYCFMPFIAAWSVDGALLLSFALPSPYSVAFFNRLQAAYSASA